MKNLIQFFLFFTFSLHSQEEIQLVNPSFEDFPRAGNTPPHWIDCGFEKNSPPDTQPGVFGVSTLPKDGHSYLGMVTRSNYTYESITQELSSSLKKNSCYSFSIFLARSLTYLSPTRDSYEQINHVSPIRLRIWGGNNSCIKEELLAETPIIINSRWLQYHFNFKPTKDIQFIIFEAFYKSPVLSPYDGNILLDNASSIQNISCTNFKSSIINKDQIPNNDRIRNIENDSFLLIKEKRIIELIDENWENVLFEDNSKDLTDQGKIALLKILKENKIRPFTPIIIGIPENAPKYNKRFDALDKFLTRHNFSHQAVDVLPVSAKDAHNWEKGNGELYFKFKD